MYSSDPLFLKRVNNLVIVKCCKVRANGPRTYFMFPLSNTKGAVKSHSVSIYVSFGVNFRVIKAGWTFELIS